MGFSVPCRKLGKMAADATCATGGSFGVSSARPTRLLNRRRKNRFSSQHVSGQSHSRLYTDKKENKSFLIYKAIQGLVVKSFMRKGFLMYEEMLKYLTLFEKAISHTVYDFATDSF
jgi:hypothetical protein